MATTCLFSISTSCFLMITICLLITIIVIPAAIAGTSNPSTQLIHNLLSHDKQHATALRANKLSIAAASLDFGRIVTIPPSAVLHPSSVQHIQALVRSSYNQSSSSLAPFPIAARGCGHSIRGQATSPNGVVVEMTKTAGVAVVSGGGPSGHYADVGGGMTWADVLNATLERGLAPVSWTDYLYLTVGGTLSNAGIGGHSFRFGPQISNVYQLDVINGKGELLRCSKEDNSELFNAVLGGLGQFGIITRARIALQPAPKRVKWVRMLYSDFSAFTRDQEWLISRNGRNDKDALDYVEGSLLMDRGSLHNWRVSSFFPPSHHPKIISLIKTFGIIYCLEVVKHYDHHHHDHHHTKQFTPNEEINESMEVVLKGLRFMKGFMYEKDASYLEFLNRVRVEELKLRSQKLWNVPHPWLNLFIPRSGIRDFNDAVFRGIVLKNNITTSGPLLFYPINRNKWDDRTSVVLPEDEDDVFYTVGFLHSSGFDDRETFDKQNNEIMELCRKRGIQVKMYLPHYKTQGEWIQHFGSKWKIFQHRKTRFDPKFILSPGQRIFNNIDNDHDQHLLTN